MKLIQVRNKQTKTISHVSEGWLARWPDDFTRVVPTDPDKPKPKRRPRRNQRDSTPPPE